LERACARALRFETANFRSIKQILEKGLEAHEPAALITSEPVRPQFARTTQQLLAGGA
jgi:hypothetical protein